MTEICMMEQNKSFGTDSHISQNNLVENESLQHALQNNYTKIYKDTVIFMSHTKQLQMTCVEN